MKTKMIVLSLGLLLGSIVCWANEGAPWPVCQPGHCQPAVVKCEKAAANVVRFVMGKPSLQPCKVDTTTSNKPLC